MFHPQSQQGYPRDRSFATESYPSQYEYHTFRPVPTQSHVPPSNPHMHYQPQPVQPVPATVSVFNNPQEQYRTRPEPYYHASQHQSYQSTASYEVPRVHYAPARARQPAYYGPVSSQQTHEHIRETYYNAQGQVRGVPYHRNSNPQAERRRYLNTDQNIAPRRPVYSTEWSHVVVDDEEKGYDERYDYEEYEESCSPTDFTHYGPYSSEHDDDHDSDTEDEGEDQSLSASDTAKDPPYSIRLLPRLISRRGIDIYNKLIPEARAIHCQNVETETLELRRENTKLRKLCHINDITVSCETLYDLAHDNRARFVQETSELYEEITTYSRKLHNWYIRAEISRLEKENQELHDTLREESIRVPSTSRNEWHPLRQYAIRVQYGQLCTDQDLGTLEYN